MWYETALEEIGLAKDLDLEISLIPHTDEPQRALRNLREMLASLKRKKPK